MDLARPQGLGKDNGDLKMSECIYRFGEADCVVHRDSLKGDCNKGEREWALLEELRRIASALEEKNRLVTMIK